MATWLVFLKGATDEFVLPVMAPSREDALKAAASAYPAAGYRVLTSYAEDELRRILTEAQQWQTETPATETEMTEASAEVTTTSAPVPAAPPAAALTSVRKQSLQKKRLAASTTTATVAPETAAEPLPVESSVAGSVVEPAVAAPPTETPPVPQDLKTMLALLKASAPAAGEPAPAPVQLEGRVEETIDEPVANVPLGTVFESRPVVSTAISRRPVAEALPPPQGRSMADIFKGLRR